MYQTQPKIAGEPCFCGKSPKKLIDMILKAKDYKSTKLSFNDAAKIYEYMGCNVLLKRGSHASVTIAPGVNIPLVIPHGSKEIAPLDIKRLKFFLNGDIEGAKNAR